jgi:hypothetical protein
MLRAGARVILVRRKIIFGADLDEIASTEARIRAQFHFGDARDLDRMTAESHEYDLPAKQYALERLEAGDKLILGEVDGHVAFYGWAMFGQLDLGIRSFIATGTDTVASYRLFTIAEQRGKRLCAAYYSFLRDELRLAGYGHVVSWVEARNSASLRVHEAAGFRRLGSIWQVRLLSRSSFLIPTAVRARLERPSSRPEASVSAADAGIERI